MNGTARRFSTDLVTQISHPKSHASSTSPQRDAQLRNGGKPQSPSGSASPYRYPGHRHSPSAPPERPSSIGRYDGGDNTLADETITEVRYEELDEHIRKAEEGIQRTYSRRPRASSEMLDRSKPESDTIRRTAVPRTSVSPVAMSASNVRRSATKSSVSARMPIGESRYHHVSVVNGDEDERDRSGSSGGIGRRKLLPAEFKTNGLVCLCFAISAAWLMSKQFTPSPKPSGSAAYASPAQEMTSSRSTQNHRYDSSTHRQDPSPLPSRFFETSRRTPEFDNILSPSDRINMRDLDGLERSASVANGQGYSKRWTDSDVGLPRCREVLDDRGLPMSKRIQQGDRRRPKSVLDTNTDRNRYSTRGGSTDAAAIVRSSERNIRTMASDRDFGSRASRLITPADPVSAVGAASELIESGKKDPLAVLRRIEAQRAELKHHWEVQRSASVLGDREGAMPSSRFDCMPEHVRPATSMSRLREQPAALRTAPIERRSFTHDEADSPSLHRAGSRMSHVMYPSTEPRPVRSSTSLGKPNLAPLDVNSASTEHCRLLIEAFQLLEAKFPGDMSGIANGFESTTRTSESINTVLRTAIQLATQIAVDIEVTPEKVRDELAKLTLILRDASRASDQNVRDLTRIMLDLTKALRDGNNSRTSNDIPRRWRPSSPSANDSPVRRHQDLLRPATSMGDYYSPSKRFLRDPIPPSMTTDRDRSPTNISSFVSTVRGLGGSTPRKEDLPPIEASPPAVFSTKQAEIPAPRNHESPRNVLRKKASATSTHTVRGSLILPSASKLRTTTAISAITAGDMSPTKARSLRSQKSTLEWDANGHAQAESSSPMSRFSFHTAEEHISSPPESFVETDAVSLLAQAAKKREDLRGGMNGLGKRAANGDADDVGRRPSFSEIFRATLRRTTGKEGR